MSNQMITWKDYQGLEGFGAGPALGADQLDALTKALVAGQDINNPGAAAGVGFPLRVESLEKTLKNVTFKMDNLRLFKQLAKLPAYNTVEEHNVIKAYGQQDTGFMSEGALPNSDDSTYERKYATVKYMGTVRSVSHQISLVNPAHGNVIANEVVSGTMWLLQMLEKALFYGDASLSALQFDGFETLIKANSPAANVIDMRGQPLTEDSLIDAALTIQDAPNYGIPTHIHMAPRVKADLVKSFFPKARYDLMEKQGNGNVGLDLKGFTSPAGDVAFEPNVFITDGGAPSAASGPSASIPSAPSISTAPTTPPDAASLFGAADAGSYYYQIQAHNDYGHSAPVDLVAGPTPVAVAAGDKMTFGVTPAGGNATKWYQLYRGKVGGAAGDLRLIARIPATGGAQTIVDLNASLPFCTSAFMWQQNLDVMSFKQLAPMMKIPLAIIDLSIRWAQVIYGVPVQYAPGKQLLFKNVGRLS